MLMRKCVRTEGRRISNRYRHGDKRQPARGLCLGTFLHACNELGCGACQQQSHLEYFLEHLRWLSAADLHAAVDGEVWYSGNALGAILRCGRRWAEGCVYAQFHV